MVSNENDTCKIGGKFSEKFNSSRKKEDESERWLNTNEAAFQLGITQNALRIMVHRGLIEYCKLGSRLKFNSRSIKSALQKMEG
jgi:hypothetical protein